MKTLVQISPRLLSLSEAARYCGVSSGTFVHICPVTPIALGESARLRKWDRHALDRWIDGFNDNDPAERPHDEWLNEMDARH